VRSASFRYLNHVIYHIPSIPLRCERGGGHATLASVPRNRLSHTASLGQLDGHSAMASPESAAQPENHQQTPPLEQAAEPAPDPESPPLECGEQPQQVPLLHLADDQHESPFLEEQVDRNTASGYHSLGDVLLTTTLVFIPFVGLNVGLIAVVTTSRYRASHSDPYESDAFDDAFYVRFSATSFVFLASLSSTLATSLVGLVMTLVSFSAAKRLASLSRQLNVDQLPTAFQLGLLIRILEAAIFDSLKHLLQRKERIKLRSLVKSLFLALAMINVIGYLER